jgi:hypothetical protein
MNVPGFTAEAAIGRTAAHYSWGSGPPYASREGVVVSASFPLPCAAPCQRVAARRCSGVRPDAFADCTQVLADSCEARCRSQLGLDF